MHHLDERSLNVGRLYSRKDVPLMKIDMPFSEHSLDDSAAGNICKEGKNELILA